MSLEGVTRTYIAAVIALSLITVAPRASADPSDARGHDPSEGGHDHDGHDHDRHDHDGEPTARRFDYSRFSDGPRRVPAPRGASFERAQRLGLGTDETAAQILRAPMPDAWRRAADWRGEPVERLLWPIDEGRYVRGYGYVRAHRPDLLHKGVDISAPVGTVVRAAADGIVAYSDNGLRGYGNCVIIAHPNGWVTLYAHNSRTTVQAGWRVRRGERIALVGSTGISRGPHVHFELRRGGPAIDPLALFDGGPAHVERAGERAARAGRVAAPRPPSAEDRRTPPPLAPWTDSPAPVRVAAPAPDEGSGDEDEAVATLGELPIGSTRLYRRLTRFRPTDAMTSAAGGRLFRNLLWPMRGGRVAEAGRDSLRAEADQASAVRASADGLVAYVGRVGRRGETIVILHRSGWVTLYANLEATSVEAGQRVERGEWIGESAALDFEVRVDGRRADPMPLLVQIPR